MIRITERSLIIEIPTRQNFALQSLLELQSGMYEVLNSIDFVNAPPEKVQWGVSKLMLLLGEMSLTENQVSLINEKMLCNHIDNKIFNGQ